MFESDNGEIQVQIRVRRQLPCCASSNRKPVTSRDGQLHPGIREGAETVATYRVDQDVVLISK